MLFQRLYCIHVKRELPYVNQSDLQDLRFELLSNRYQGDRIFLFLDSRIHYNFLLFYNVTQNITFAIRL